MSSTLTAEQDRLQVPPDAPANWSENLVCIFNAPDSGLAGACGRGCSRP